MLYDFLIVQFLLSIFFVCLLTIIHINIFYIFLLRFLLVVRLHSSKQTSSCFPPTLVSNFQALHSLILFEPLLCKERQISHQLWVSTEQLLLVPCLPSLSIPLVSSPFCELLLSPLTRELECYRPTMNPFLDIRFLCTPQPCSLPSTARLNQSCVALHQQSSPSLTQTRPWSLPGTQPDS